MMTGKPMRGKWGYQEFLAKQADAAPVLAAALKDALETLEGKDEVVASGDSFGVIEQLEAARGLALKVDIAAQRGQDVSSIDTTTLLCHVKVALDDLRSFLGRHKEETSEPSNQ